jgi:thioredoxin 1
LVIISFIAFTLFACTGNIVNKGNSSEGNGQETQGGDSKSPKSSASSKEAQDVPHLLGTTQFENEVLNYEGPVLVDFGAGWCPPCRMLTPHLAKLAREMQGTLKVVKVYEDEKGKPNIELLQKYKIGAYPTLIIFKSGEVVNSRMGYSDYSQLKEWVEKSL